MTKSAPNLRDRDYLDRLRDYYAESRHIPSLKRICEMMGFASKAAAKKMMHRLEGERFVERAADDAAWIPARRFFERSLAMEAVPAGMPVAPGDTAGEPFMVDDYVVRSPSRTVMVPVKGDSMIDAGIHDGDVAVIERGRAAGRGDLVVAIVDNELTLKELGLERGRFILKPRNPAFAVIRPKGELEIFGVMVGLIRRYRH